VSDYSAASLFRLDGRTAVLTGASGFLGRNFAEALLQNGAGVVALGRSERLAAETDRWKSAYGANRVEAVRVDMHDTDRLSALLDEVAARHAIDIIINNAHELTSASGFNVPNGGLEGATRDHWARNFDGCYWAALTVQKLGPGMINRGGGSVVNVATMYALVAPSPKLYAGTAFINPPGYSAAKAALMALTRYVASFWGPHNIRCNAILPGPFSNTDDATANAVKTDDPFLSRLCDRTTLGRFGRPKELAGALLFLVSDASSYVTGHGLVVDGGWTVV
jgi:NAD(P)-dependent dehydrogenase (short-subunit alcohol dehydrogenase family)